MTWTAAEGAAYRVLGKARAITDLDPAAYREEDDEHALTKAMREARAAASENLWLWDGLRLAASETATDEAALSEAAPERVAWAYVRSLLSPA